MKLRISLLSEYILLQEKVGLESKCFKEVATFRYVPITSVSNNLNDTPVSVICQCLFMVLRAENAEIY